MALKKDTPPKVQRGISLTPEMYERIKNCQIVFGTNWNGAAVELIAIGLRTLSNSSESGEDSRKPVAPSPVKWGQGK